MTALRVVLVDDHTLFREGTAELLELDPDVEVVAQGSSGDDALELVARHQPEVALVDVEMPGPGIRSLVGTLQRKHPATAVVVLTMHDDANLVRDVLARGARAFLSKACARAELIAVVRSVASRSDSGSVMLSVSRNTVDQLDRSSSPLSEREREVLTLLAEAKSNAVIGKQLHIAEGTVKRHLTNIYAKLDATSRMDAVRKGFASGLLSNAES